MPARAEQTRGGGLKTKAKRKSHAPRKRAAASAFALDADCSLSNATALYRKLTRLAARVTPVTLDAGAVTHIDTASLQLLLAFVNERRARGRPLLWRGRTPEFNEAAATLGLTAAFETESA